MTFTLARIEALAPDQASLSAGLKLAKPKAWAVLGRGVGFAWGECQGSGASPYKVILGLDDGAAKCTCPSRKFPCKHAIGLMLLIANAEPALVEGDAPSWAGDWIAKRKPRASRPPPQGAEAPGDKASLAVALEASEAEPAAADPSAVERAARQRERLAAEREASVADGFDALDRWIADALERGMVAFAAQARAQCATIARRLVDAKAPALAARLDALPSEILALPENRRPDALLGALGGLHLLAEAYRRRDTLPAGLAAEVRRLVGWSLDRAALLAQPDAARASGRWLVIATRTENQPDRLRRIETWLMAEGEGTKGETTMGEAARRFAVLMDFVPMSTSATGNAFVVGERFEAELCFYPAATPLRAIVVSRGASEERAACAIAGAPLETALAKYAGDLAINPWLPAWPIALGGVAVRRDAAGALWIADGEGASTAALPTPPADSDDLLALADGGPVDMVGLWDGRQFRALAAATPLGAWFHA